MEREARTCKKPFPLVATVVQMRRLFLGVTVVSLLVTTVSVCRADSNVAPIQDHEELGVLPRDTAHKGPLILFVKNPAEKPQVLPSPAKRDAGKTPRVLRENVGISCIDYCENGGGDAEHGSLSNCYKWCHDSGLK